VPPGRDVVVIESVGATAAAAITICRFDVAVWAVGEVESVTLIVTVVVPTEPCAGVPVIAPVELLIDNPLGRPLALSL
jgi:hypothetical protein